jgi:hypothetical protein
MSHIQSFIIACLAFSALPFLSHWGGDTSALAAPPSNPNPTTDFSGLTQSWDKNLPSASRFTVLAAFNNAAVRDNNTGLVWEQSPDTTARTWGFVNAARTDCANKTVGGTTGWRLPSVIELKSLQDPSLSPPFVPASIFTNVQSGTYWSATTVTDFPNDADAWAVTFFDNGIVFAGNKQAPHFVWCVRGNMNADAY